MQISVIMKFVSMCVIMHACMPSTCTSHLAFHFTTTVCLPLQPSAAVPHSPHTPHMARQMVSDMTENIRCSSSSTDL